MKRIRSRLTVVNLHLHFNCFSADEFPRFNIGEGQKIILSKKDIKT